jgi:hypothetical protein
LVRAFGGRRLLLAGPVPGYDVIGAGRGEDALVREAVQNLRDPLHIAPALKAGDGNLQHN